MPQNDSSSADESNPLLGKFYKRISIPPFTIKSNLLQVQRDLQTIQIMSIQMKICFPFDIG